MLKPFISDIVIGLEVHIELDTKTKLFCSCPTQGNEEPNTRTCAVCLGMPGSKPVLNKKALEYALKLCMALDCEIAPELIFSRKSYFYPDLAKNYQITQYEMPLGKEGALTLKHEKKIGLIRVHIEEDPASLIHPAGTHASGYVLVDYNRSGNPLLEIVTNPEIGSAEEARDFMKNLITLLGYLHIFDRKKGIIKADANISIKESNYVRQEVKNITGFKEIERALLYEIQRQKKEIAEGKKLHQETRAWDAEKGITTLLRKKETEEDYGYILDSDLVVTEITEDMLQQIQKSMPELPHHKIKKFITHHKISQEDAEIIAAEKQIAELFENVAAKVDPHLAAKWIRRELSRVLNYSKKELNEAAMEEQHLIDLLTLIEKKSITDSVGQKILEKLIDEAFDVHEYVQKEGLHSISDISDLEMYCKEAIENNPKAVDDFKRGESKAINFLIGQVMKKTKGKATPQELNEIMTRIIG